MVYVCICAHAHRRSAMELMIFMCALCTSSSPESDGADMIFVVRQDSHCESHCIYGLCMLPWRERMHLGFFVVLHDSRYARVGAIMNYELCELCELATDVHLGYFTCAFSFYSELR